MLWKIFRVRLSEDDMAQLTKAAAQLEISTAAMARIYLREGFAEYDRKHEALLHRLTVMQDEIQALKSAQNVTTLLMASNLAAVSSCDVPRIDRKQAGAGERFKNSVKSSFQLGAVIEKSYLNGEFNPEA